MRCNPSRWLWGLIPLAMLGWGTNQRERPTIEYDLTRRADAALVAAGQKWAHVQFTGRDGVILGRARKDGEPKVALDAARAIWGVRTVKLHTDLAQASTAAAEERAAKEKKAEAAAKARREAEAAAEAQTKRDAYAAKLKDAADAAAAQAKAKQEAEAVAHAAKLKQQEAEAAEAQAKAKREAEAAAHDTKAKEEAAAAARAAKLKQDAEAAELQAKAKQDAEAAARAAKMKQDAEAQVQAKAKQDADAAAAAKAKDAAAHKQAEGAIEAARAKYAAEVAAAAGKGKPLEEAKAKPVDEPKPRVAAVEAPRKTTAETQSCQDRLAAAAKSGSILFSRASADIDPQSSHTIARLSEIVKACPGMHIEVQGHTDSEGEPDRNKNLSERRARAVVRSLVHAGVDGSRLTAVGFGAERPVAKNDTPENMALNRRIEFKVFSN